MRGYADLPVCIDLPGQLGAEITRYVESEAGWQVVSGDGPLRPVLTIAGAATAQPCVVVTAAPADPALVRDALRAGALDVVAWPEERARLLDAPRRLRRDHGERRGRPIPALLRVAGARGGAGTSTVALAVAAAVAWAGGRALVVGGNDLLRLAGRGAWTGPGAAEISLLGDQAHEEVAAVAAAVPGVPGLQVLGGGGTVTDVAAWPYELVVCDARTEGLAEAELVVGCADSALASVPPHPRVVVVEHGPLDRAGVQRSLGRPPSGWLPYSARVARAGSAGRVPSALPGTWLHALRRAVHD